MIKSIPYFEALFLVVALPFIMTSYDLNPLACFTGPDESTITFNNVTGRVNLNFTPDLINYQKIAISLSLVLMIPIASFAVLLFCNYKSVINSMIAEIDKDDIPEPDDSNNSSGENGGITLTAAMEIINVVTDTTENEIARRMTDEEIPINELAETITSELNHVQ